MAFDCLIVGAGFAGAVCAERLASEGYKVFIIDRRPHLGGNAYDEFDAHGFLIHTYGPHLFHTRSRLIWDYLSRFTQWRHYEHRVLAKVGEQLLPIPINRTTINNLYGLDLDEKGVEDYLERVREPKEPIKNSEDLVLSAVGEDLCDKFFRGYTRKQWGMGLAELSVAVAARIPTRTNDDDRYFTDEFQAIPLDGYTKVFERMLTHPNITVGLATEYDIAMRSRTDFAYTIYTGPVDAFYDFCFGRLPYRSLRFEHEHHGEIDQFQPVGTVNYPNDYDYTRITEFKHITGQTEPGTSIVREYPEADGDPYYPIPRAENEALFKRYKELADQELRTIFVGRLAQYRYYNMDQVVGAALTAVDTLLKRMKTETIGND